MKMKSRSLNVLMNGIRIGILEKSSKGLLRFSYDDRWINTAGARPISLSLSLTGKSFEGEIVYHFFDNLLPDNLQIRARIQTKFQVATNQPFDLLECIGRDCVGAIQIISDPVPTFKHIIKYERLSEQDIAEILRSYQTNPLGMTDRADDFRISIAGAQEKSAFLYHQGHWCRPIKETPTSHIFKLPIGYLPHANMDLTDSCENEWLCSQIADAFGIPVAKCEILNFEEIKVLSVERFDRRMASDHSWLMRLPQEDMCQVLGMSPYLKYQSDGGPGITEMMRILLGSSQPNEDRNMFFRAQILFWLLAAIDGHAKNFSVFIEPEGKFRLTPLYDMMSAYPLIANKQLHAKKIKMAMALKSKNMHYQWYNVQRRHFLEAAKSARYSIEKAEIILDDMLGQVDHVIKKVSAKLPKRFPRAISTPIFEGMRQMSMRLAK